MIDINMMKEGYLVIPDKYGYWWLKDCTLPSQYQLEVELARNFGVILKGKIPEQLVLDFFTELHLRKLLKTQPFFPKLLPVEIKDEEELKELAGKEVKYCVTILESKLIEELKERNVDMVGRASFLWLSQKFNQNTPEQLLFKFMSLFYDPETKRFKGVGRRDRMNFMKELETKITIQKSLPYLTIKSWKKVAHVLHPRDYHKRYPKAVKYIMRIVKKERIEPEKIKLRTLIQKAWTKGEDSECFEKFLDDPSMTIEKILESLQDYEMNPRITKYKRTGLLTFGRENPGDDEKEVVDLIKLQLREKLFRMLKPKKERVVYIPQEFSQISASFLLEEVTKLAIWSSEENLRLFSSDDTAFKLMVFSVETGEQLPLQNFLETDSVLVASSTTGFEKLRVVVKGNPINLKIKEKSQNIILFIHGKKDGGVKFVGKPLKTFYAGKPVYMRKEDWKKVYEIFYSNTPFLTLKDLAEKLYTVKNWAATRLTYETLKKDVIS